MKEDYMKILIATPYIYKKEWPEFTRNRTGFGIMVNDIFESISGDTDTYLLSQVITEGHGNVLKHTWGDVFGSARLKDWGKGFKYFFGYPQGIKGRVKYFYYALNSGSIRKTIRKIKPDVVHIQGIGAQIKPFIDVCEEEGVPYIVTLHGLIGMDGTVRAASWDKQMEKDFLIEADKKDIPLTVISTGMKRRIEENYLGHEAKSITVVCNGTRIPYDENLINLESLDLRKEFDIKQDEKIIVTIGSVCERKNQIQIVRALEKVETPCHVFFCGADVTDGDIQKAIDEAGLSGRIHMLGFQLREKVDQILDQADLNVVASKDEGFGLSIIEAYSHGVPTVTFADLDAIPDLFSEQAMVKVAERSDATLSAGIEEGLERKWDKTWIKEYAKSFSLQKLAEQYKVEYRQVLTRGGAMSLAKTIDYLAIQRLLGYKILAYVGNITDNKNQIELVRLMPELEKEKCISVLVGREMDGGKVRSYVLENKIANVILAGFCSEMDSIWINIDLNVFISKNDGFGLSIIEGYMRGVPSVMNQDLDAYEDVVCDDALVSTRIGNSKKVIEAIEVALSNEWCRNKIINGAVAFSVGEMARLYLTQYHNAAAQ